MEAYQPTAYRFDDIPILPSGGHPKLDKVFERLSWGHYQTPVVPNAVEVQLAYASLFSNENDAEDGFPWNEESFSIGKGFLNGFQSLLYMIHICAVLLFYLALFPLFFSIIFYFVDELRLSALYTIAQSFTIM